MSNNKYLTYFTLILTVLIFQGMITQAFAQKKTKIQLIRAESMLGKNVNGEELNIFIGDVVFEHDSAYLYCDSAVFDNKQNNLRSYGKVHVKVNDTLSLFSDTLNYNGNTRIGVATGNVKMVDSKATLLTDHLTYNRLTQIAFYTTGGKIINEDNELVSKKGYYHTETKDLFFKEDVVLTNPEYIVESDTLKYNTSSEIAFIAGPTTIKGKDEFLYAEDGWYDTKSDKTELILNPWLTYKNQYLSGDKIFYDKASGAGRVLGNAFIKDTVQKVIVTGNYADFRRKDGYAYATDSATAILIDKKDSLFMHADTLRLTFDSTDNPQKLLAFYKCKFFKTDIQGMCDSLVYSFSDSTITLFHSPVLWTQENQLTAENIIIYSSNQQVDSMNMTNSSFIISVDKFNNENFNQIKGKNMTGYFKENELFKMTVTGNSETVYFVREEDGAMIGINKGQASNMDIYITDRQISDILYFENPDAILYPEKEFPKEELKLRDFKWFADDRPYSKRDIYRWEKVEPVLKR